MAALILSTLPLLGRPRCKKCGRPVESVEAYETRNGDEVVVWMRCHGKLAEVRMRREPYAPRLDALRLGGDAFDDEVPVVLPPVYLPTGLVKG